MTKAHDTDISTLMTQVRVCYFVAVYTVFRKKHPLTFSFISL